MSELGPLLILGLGNVRCGDDGLGAVAVALITARYEAPPGVEVVAGASLGPSLLPHVEDAGAVILVDAIRADAPPGAFVRLEDEEVGPAVEERLSPHRVGVAALQQGAGLSRRKLLLVGLVPKSLEQSGTLSSTVEAGLVGLVKRVVLEARLLGYEFKVRRECVAEAR